MRGEIEDVVRAAEMLADPFDPKELKFKPQMVKNNRALAMPYIDARCVQDRLDEVVGVDGWQDRYEVLPDGSVVCTLRVRLGGRWITKTDVGSLSEQPDGGDRLKAAFSDALKRAAVKFGVGRYLYRLPATWVDYDPVKKQLTQAPQLPDWALPGGFRMPPKPAPAPAPKPPANLPATGAELHRRLSEYEGRLVVQKACVPGALMKYVADAGLRAGYPANVAAWSGPAIAFAVEVVKEFEAGLGR